MIIIIIILILIYLIYIKKFKTEYFTDIDMTKEEYLKFIENKIVQKFQLNNSGTRTFTKLCNYFHPNNNKLILPAETILETNLNTQNLTVNGDCVLEGLTEINNLTVTGNIYIKNKNSTYNDNNDYTRNVRFNGPSYNNYVYNNVNDKYLDILPKGSIIPWIIDKKIPNGWVIAYNQAKFKIDDTIINFPNMYKRRIQGCNKNTETGSLGGNSQAYLEEKHIPNHSHRVNIGFDYDCYSNDKNAGKCKTFGFFLTSPYTNSFRGNTNKILSSNTLSEYGYNNQDISKTGINLESPCLYVYYIMKI